MESVKDYDNGSDIIEKIFYSEIVPRFLAAPTSNKDDKDNKE